MIFRVHFIPKQQNTFFSSARGSFSKTEYMVGHKISLNKFKKIEISSIFSDHKGQKIEINLSKKLKNIQMHGG